MTTSKRKFCIECNKALTKDEVAYKNYSEVQSALEKAKEPIGQVWKKSYEVMMDIEHNRLENSYEKFSYRISTAFKIIFIILLFAELLYYLL